MFGLGGYDFLLIAGFLGVQYFLSTRKSVYWGAIIPVVFVSWLSWMFVTYKIESVVAYVLTLMIGLLFLSEQWSKGRNTSRKQ